MMQRDETDPSINPDILNINKTDLYHHESDLVLIAEEVIDNPTVQEGVEGDENVQENANLRNDEKVTIAPGTTAAYKRVSPGKLRESYRIIYGKGSIIKVMSDGSHFIMHSNGNTCKSAGDGYWITTNNKGLRKKFDVKNNIQIELDEIPTVSKSTSPYQEYPKIWLREDNVKIILYEDQRRMVIHEDGTRILTNADGKTFIVEHENFAACKIIYENPDNSNNEDFTNREFYGLPCEQRLLYGFGDLLNRSVNQRCCEVYLPDGNKLVSSLEMNCSNNNVESVLYLECLDQTIIKCKQNGKVMIVPTENKHQFRECMANANKYPQMKEWLVNKIDYIEGVLLEKKEA